MPLLKAQSLIALFSLVRLPIKSDGKKFIGGVVAPRTIAEVSSPLPMVCVRLSQAVRIIEWTALERGYAMSKHVAKCQNCAVLFAFCLLCFVGCKTGSSAKHQFVDGGSDSLPFSDGGGSDEDTGSSSEVVDTTTPETDEPEPGSLGEACWIEIFKKWHPNYGLSDCSSGLRCIGDNDEAWCTKKCHVTGALNEEDSEIEDWCCGDLAQPCDPQKYWLPSSMSFACIPRTALLAESCDVDPTWTGANRRCAPRCNGTSLIQETQCAQADEGAFCTFQCDPVNGDATCLLEPAFEGGCCGEIMGGHWCLIPALCDGTE